MKRAKEFYYIRFVIICCIIFEAWFTTNQAFKNITHQTRQMLCLADWLINSFGNFQSDGIGLLIILTSILLIIGDDFRYSNLLQYKSRRELWDSQVRQIVQASILYGTCYTLCVCLFTLKKSNIYCNWQEAESYFFIVNKTLLKCQIQYVVIALLVGVVINWVMLAIISLILHWILKQEALVWIIIIALKFIETSIIHINLEADLSYKKWIDNMVLPGLIGSLLIVILMYFIGRGISYTKEFYVKDDA